ncbi:isocitrate lyase/PEP mutase family protein [Actinoplanes aureus]|uniref:Isocitrate lyase/phosphoenolpyruvate mutase family protein n=1 Tax=Actinoplanes aureus TaxID=2792083 RepID=A0A931C863_9ACTN|nr:isocitrate lyase/phosphoenolpyruvate mutase family protein [Actinoplanes aureus]MBG0562716.1 isocitrate lyase/phosphoenolpyruvate mutase family protein [Actinoplanes aureus]
MTATALRALLASDHVTHVPGVYDPVTAALAVRAGHRAVHLSGAAVTAIALGGADLGFAHGTQIADRATTLIPALGGVPLLADAGTGYDDPLHAVWTGLAYARAGISGLHLDDQVNPDHRGQPVGNQVGGRERAGRAVAGREIAGREIAGIGLAAAKISALADQVPELALIARTSTYAAHGLAETIVRCRAYAEAGADAVLPEGVDSLDELAEMHRAMPGVPIVISRSEAGGNHPAITDADLAAVGVRLVLHPVSALLAAMRAASLVYRAIAESGSAEPVDRMPWAAFTALVGQEEALDPDARYVPGGLQT